MINITEDYQPAYISLRSDVLFWRKVCGYSEGAILAKVQNWTNLAYSFTEIADAKAKVLAELANNQTNT